MLLERAEALARLDELLVEAALQGRIALISGPAGIGKSALAAAFTARASGRARVLSGSCDPLATPRALGPMHDVARQAGGPLALAALAVLSAEGTREQMFTALLTELAAAPNVVLVEDAHWADAATLDLLMFAGRRIAQTRTLLIVTFRDDELGPDHPLPRVLAALPRHGVSRFPLVPLSTAAVTTLAAAAGRDTAAVFAATGGNPLLVTEALAADAAEVPATVAQLILGRVEALPAAARRAARLVSVVPGRADRLVPVGASGPVEACLAAGVLVTAGDGLAFRHELLRRAVHDALSPQLRAELHATVLAALVAAGADPARLAHHARLAGDIPALLRHAPPAARRAAAVNAHREAADHLRSVLPHAHRLPRRDHVEMLQFFAEQAQLTGAAADGLPAALQALAGWEELGEPARAGAVLQRIGLLNWWAGRKEASEAAHERSIGVLEAIPPTTQLAMAYSLRGRRFLQADDPDAAVAWSRRALDMATELGDARSAIHARVTIATAGLRHRDGGGAELEQIHRDAVDAGLIEDAGAALTNLATSAGGSGSMERAIAFAYEHDLLGHETYLLAERSRTRLEEGDWDGAEADALHAVEGAGDAGVSRIPALVTLGRLRARRGDPTALSTLDDAERHAAATAELPWIAAVAGARSEYFWLEGDLARAADEAGRWLPHAVEGNHAVLAGALAFRAWRAGRTSDLPTAIDDPHRLLIDGDWAAAAAEWERRGCTYSRAEALACGDGPATAAALRIVDALGATRVAQRWRAELRSRGMKVPRGPRRSTAANPAELTTRQLDVLRLLAEGLTTPQIAQRLGMAPKTVSSHVAGVLDKLDVNTRGQAAAVAVRLGILRR